MKEDKEEGGIVVMMGIDLPEMREYVAKNVATEKKVFTIIRCYRQNSLLDRVRKKNLLLTV